jgi:predicted dinucleotide-binding enzyme
MKVVIIGAGNVAHVLGRKMLLSGHVIEQIISRNIENACALAGELGCGYGSTFQEVIKDADFYVIAISDNALIEINKKLFLDTKLIVHTAGSISKDVLKQVSRNYGVIYPLQSLRKEIKAIPEIPLLVDANTPDNLTLIYDFAKTISNTVKKAGDEERAKLHVGAIMVNNFTNYLYGLTEQYCKKEHINFKLLLPLINETGVRLRDFSPFEVQTGPAVRNDVQTIQKHMELLASYPALKNIYKLMTQNIGRDLKD